MSLNITKNMLYLNLNRDCMWNKYKNESKQSICIIGVLILSAKLCKADGHFGTNEEEEILKIIPHESYQKRLLIKILEEAYNDLNPIEHDAKNLRSLLQDEHPEFLEFIVAALYKLAHSDHVYSKAEDEDIRSVAKIFGIKQNFFDKIKIGCKDYFIRVISYLKIKKKDYINA
jgi:uncharacterized tellurite resistance protein B-like protein